MFKIKYQNQNQILSINKHTARMACRYQNNNMKDALLFNNADIRSTFLNLFYLNFSNEKIKNIK